MITKTDLFTRIRRLLGDEDIRTYSDYDLETATADALSYLSRHLACLGSDLTTVSTVLADGDTLPDDFITLRAVCDTEGRPLIPVRIGLSVADGGYRIEGDTFRTAGHALVTYQRSLPPFGENGEIDLPASLTDTIAKTVVLTLSGADDAARQKALLNDDLLITRRMRTRRTPDLPWRI